MKVEIVYDQNCPFCSDFVRVLEVKQAGHDVEFINARDAANPRIKILSMKYNLDDGMVVIVDGVEYYGDSAAHIMAMLSSTNTYRGAFYKLILKNKILAAYFYPVLVILRKLFFRLTRRKLINDEI